MSSLINLRSPSPIRAVDGERREGFDLCHGRELLLILFTVYKGPPASDGL